MTSEEPQAEARAVLPTPNQLRGFAARLRALTPFAQTYPFHRVLNPETVTVIADSLVELARLRGTSARHREALLEEQVDAYGILAASRRLPLAAVQALVLRAEGAGRKTVSVEELKRALATVEPKP